MNAFNSACQVEAKGMEQLIEMVRQQSLDGQCVVTDKGRLSRDLQVSFGDMFMNGKDGRIWAIECKTEENYTGNLFLESWSNKSRWTTGWMYKLNTDVLLYQFLSREEVYAISFERLRRWAFGHGRFPGNIYQFPELRQRKRDQPNDTYGWCVPIDVIGQNVGFELYSTTGVIHKRESLIPDDQRVLF